MNRHTWRQLLYGFLLMFSSIILVFYIITLFYSILSLFYVCISFANVCVTIILCYKLVHVYLTVIAGHDISILMHTRYVQS